MNKVPGFEAWTPVSENHTQAAITAEVWNRRITLDRSVLPTSIQVGGRELLHGPITLNADFSGKTGEWGAHRVIATEQTPERVRYSVAQSTENLIVNADVSLEFDGFLRVDLSLIPFWSFDPDNVPRLTGLSMDIPIRRACAPLFHFWPNCESGVCLSGKVLNSFALPPEGLTLPFKPYLWSGWEEGGLGICCESDRGFELADPARCVTVSVHDDFVNLHIALLDHTPADWAGRADAWGNNVNPISFSFGFQPTPVKPFPNANLQNWRAFHLYDVQHSTIFDPPKGDGSTMLEQIAASGANWLILHEDWTVIQNYGLPRDESEFRAFVQAAHRLGLRVMVYFGYEVSSLLPGFAGVCGDYLNKNTRGNFVGGWQREPMQRDFTVCYHGGYSDVMLKRVCHAMDDYGVDGIYTDGTYVPWECANEAHGCGWRDARGTLHEVYPIFAVREHVKKLYRAVHARGGVVDTHQSSCCLMATLAFADSYFDGENIQGFISEDIRRMRMDVFRAEFLGRNMGIPCNFISYTNQGFDMKMILGFTLVNGVLPRANRMADLPVMAAVWRILDDFGTQEAQWHPYYQNPPVRADHGWVSYYQKDDALLLFLYCSDPEVSAVTVTLNGDYTSARECLDPAVQPQQNGTQLVVPVQFAHVRIVEVRR